MRAIEIAEQMYDDAGKDFGEVLHDHLDNGIVFTSPTWLLMMKAIELPTGQPAWFIECAVGDTHGLAAIVNELIELPFISFCRVKNGKKQTKVYEAKRLIQIALAQK